MVDENKTVSEIPVNNHKLNNFWDKITVDGVVTKNEKEDAQKLPLNGPPGIVRLLGNPQKQKSVQKESSSSSSSSGDSKTSSSHVVV